MVEVQGEVGELLLDVADNLTLGGGGEPDTTRAKFGDKNSPVDLKMCGQLGVGSMLGLKQHPSARC